MAEGDDAVTESLTRILFVDDEPQVLDGLRRMLRPLAAEWEMEFVESGEEALTRISAQPFDVIVTDMRMPGMDGVQLLEQVRALHPDAIRIVLSGHSDPQTILRSVGSTHQYLSKPCDPDRLRTMIRRSWSLQNLLGSDRLKQLVGGMDHLPSMPTLFRDVVRELQGPDASLKKVGALIAKDPSMTAQILRLVNSSFFGMSREISSPTAAVAYLGIGTVTSLVLSVKIFQEANPQLLHDLQLEGLWDHSFRTGTLARDIALEITNDQQMAEDCFTSGMLHDVGKLVLCVNFPGRYRDVLGQPSAGLVRMSEAESQAFGANHAEIGAYLMGIWGLPTSIVEAVAFHHAPLRCFSGEFAPVVAVHVANCLDAEGGANSTSVEPLDEKCVGALGLTRRIARWRERVRAVAVDSGTSA